jgi:integrase
MSIYKRGGVYWFHFWFRGEHVQRSTRQGNPRTARQMEAAFRTALAKGEVGIIERKPAPTLKDFAQRFVDYIQVRCAEKPATVRFYAEKLTRVLEFEPMAEARLDRIDEALIESYVQHRSKRMSPASINRELATLRRALRLAQEWRLIDRVPRIRLLPGERIREFVLSRTQEAIYLQMAPQPLRDFALLALDTGLRQGEALALQWRDVQLEPVNGAKFGFLRVREGKSRNAKRGLPLTAKVRAMLAARLAASKAPWVFPGDNGKPFLGTSLDHQHKRVRDLLRLPADFVIHSLRHTALTRLGESGADAFTIMRIAGHSSVTVSQRYMHPTSETVERAFERLELLNAGATESLPEGPKQLPPATVSATLAAGQ